MCSALARQHRCDTVPECCMGSLWHPRQHKGLQLEEGLLGVLALHLQGTGRPTG